MNPPQCLVVAKAPVPGAVKTRLGSVVGMREAAEVAAAALMDTLVACGDAFGAERCHLALAGDLGQAVGAPEIEGQLRGWTVFGQVGDTFARRLAAAHAEVGRRTGAGTVQLGMDTPQVTGPHLAAVAAALEAHPAVLGPARDGGWWVLALRRPAHAGALTAVPTSTVETAALTRRALRRRGLDVGTAGRMRDVDTVDDARAVAGQAPRSRFAAVWSRIDPGVP